MTPRHPLRERGQELVEYALTLPIFLLLVFGIFDMGRGVYYYSALQNAAREGARYAIVNACDNAGVIARVKARTLGLNPADVIVPVYSPAWGEDTVQVTARFSFQLVTPIVGKFIPYREKIDPRDGSTVICEVGTICMESDSTMQRETWLQPDCGG